MRLTGRAPIVFDDFNRLTEEQCFILTDGTKNNFLDLCFDIPSNSLRPAELSSIKQAMGCLLVKLRLGLSNPVLVTLFSLSDKKTVSHIVESARNIPMTHFARKHLSFEHVSRQDVITRDAIGQVFSRPAPVSV